MSGETIRIDVEKAKQAQTSEPSSPIRKRSKSALVRSKTTSLGDRQRVQESKDEENIRFLILPWSRTYKSWWYLTVCGAILTIFTETFNISFQEAGLKPYDDTQSIVELILVGIFVIDIVVTFNLAYVDDETGDIVYDKNKIARTYCEYYFWIDIMGVFPFYVCLLKMTDQYGQNTTTAQYLALVRLVRMVRLRRMAQVFDILQYNAKIGLMTLTLTRNFAFALVWSHFAACVMHFIARQYNYDPVNTWIGGSYSFANETESKTELYLTSLYWSVTTFTTVGYGDFSPVNSVEQVWGMIYMLLNIIFQAWVIGSITLLIVRQDEKTGEYREALAQLNLFATINDFDRPMMKSLKSQLRLEFENRELSDESVLVHFPSSTRRKVLRKMYLRFLKRTKLMKGIRQQFVDSFLATCQVEIFSAGEEILTFGSITSDLYLLVGGTCKLVAWGSDSNTLGDEPNSPLANSPIGGTSIADTDQTLPAGRFSKDRYIEAGEFINEIGFFTESPQVHTVQTKTVCKTLTISRAAYQQLATDHPGSVGKILHNLLLKAKEMAAEYSTVELPNRAEVLRASSIFINASTELDQSRSSSMRSSFIKERIDRLGQVFHEDLRIASMQVQTQQAVTDIQDLVERHMNKLKDDHTTRFLFSASRGDAFTLSYMCDQGFDPNSADYDFRTALMVASMKGNTEAVRKLLEYHANPNLVDMHGSSALYEATREGHEDTMDVLLEHGAELCMSEGKAASILCQSVFDGDMLQLRRLLHANIPVNAGDYDRRTASHIAAAEGNVQALKILVEFGADLELRDRWHNSVFDEARREENTNHVWEYLCTLKKPNETEA